MSGLGIGPLTVYSQANLVKERCSFNLVAISLRLKDNATGGGPGGNCVLPPSPPPPPPPPNSPFCKTERLMKYHRLPTESEPHLYEWSIREVRNDGLYYVHEWSHVKLTQGVNGLLVIFGRFLASLASILLDSRQARQNSFLGSVFPED